MSLLCSLKSILGWDKVLSCIFTYLLFTLTIWLHVFMQTSAIFTVLYADDILIFAPFLRELQTTVSICELKLARLMSFLERGHCVVNGTCSSMVDTNVSVCPLRRECNLKCSGVMRVDLSPGLGGTHVCPPQPWREIDGQSSGQSTPRSHSRCGTESWTELELAFHLTVTFLIRLQGPNDSLH